MFVADVGQVVADKPLLAAGTLPLAVHILAELVEQNWAAAVALEIPDLNYAVHNVPQLYGACEDKDL